MFEGIVNLLKDGGGGGVPWRQTLAARLLLLLSLRCEWRDAAIPNRISSHPYCTCAAALEFRRVDVTAAKFVQHNQHEWSDMTRNRV